MDKETGYIAMIQFLKNWYSITESDDIGELLSLMEYLEDGKSADPAMWEYWEDSINKAKAHSNHFKKIIFPGKGMNDVDQT